LKEIFWIYFYYYDEPTKQGRNENNYQRSSHAKLYSKLFLINYLKIAKIVFFSGNYKEIKLG